MTGAAAGPRARIRFATDPEAIVRRLVPDGRSLELQHAYARLDPPATGWVAVGMVTAVDGAVAVDGRSGGLGGDGDLAAFRGLRDVADVVVVGAGTALAEDYRPTVTVHDDRGRARRGQSPRPRLALVTGSGRIDPDARVVGDPSAPPLVLTTSSGAEELAGRGAAAEPVVLGDGDDVDPRAAVAWLRANGMPRVVVEGGPTLNAAWLSAGVVDELFVTLAPVLVGSDGPGIAGVLDGAPVGLVLHEVRVHDGELLLRYLVGRDGYRHGSDEGG